MTNENLLEMDELSLYFGEPYKVNDYITITLPKVGDVVKYGEREYYSVIQTLTAIPSDMKSQLWDMKIDWTQITDFQLFMMLAPTLSHSKTQIIFGDIDFQAMRPFENKANDTVILANPETGVVIDELAYGKITAYLCAEEDRQKIKYNAKQPYKSFLRQIISAVKCRMGYSLDYVKNMGLYELTDDLARLNIIVQSDALLKGSYSGMVDTSKIPKKNFDWTRAVEK